MFAPVWEGNLMGSDCSTPPSPLRPALGQLKCQAMENLKYLARGPLGDSSTVWLRGSTC